MIHTNVKLIKLYTKDLIQLFHPGHLDGRAATASFHLFSEGQTRLLPELNFS